MKSIVPTSHFLFAARVPPATPSLRQEPAADGKMYYGKVDANTGKVLKSGADDNDGEDGDSGPNDGPNDGPDGGSDNGPERK